MNGTMEWIINFKSLLKASGATARILPAQHFQFRGPMLKSKLLCNGDETESVMMVLRFFGLGERCPPWSL